MPIAVEASFEEAVDRRSTQPVKAILDDLRGWGLGQEHIAAVAGVSRQAVHKWSVDESKPARDRWERLVKLAAVCERVDRTQDVHRWLTMTITGSIPPLARLDFARVGRFDLLVAMLDRALEPAKAALEAFPSRPRPTFETVATVADSGVIVKFPVLRVFGHGPTLEAAQADLVEVVRAVVESADDDDRAAGQVRPYLDSDVALHRALYGE